MVIPPFSMWWMRSKRIIEQHYQTGRLPQNAASVVFKVYSKVVGKKLLTEMWVVGVKFRALPFITDRADVLCRRCSQWGHSEFRCHQDGALTCSTCSGQHRTEGHRCEVTTCGASRKACSHTALKRPNCGGSHPAQDARCKEKTAAIAIARDVCMPKEGKQQPQMTHQAPSEQAPRVRSPGLSIECTRVLGRPGPLSWVPVATATPPPAIPTLDEESNLAIPAWTEDAMEIAEQEPSGTPPPIAV